jgi:NTP pyrophosphatase (non-canonical NTP hydrolase)
MLSFETLRKANRLRLPQFKNSKGGLAHDKHDGSDWTPAQWLQAVVGELGEFANIRKKFERGDLSFDEYRVAARKELADVATYLDILSMRALDYEFRDKAPWVREPWHVDSSGIDLGDAVRDKFNEVSKRVGSNVSIVDNDVRVVAQYNGANDLQQGVTTGGESFKPEEVKFPPQPIPYFTIGRVLEKPIKIGDAITVDGQLHRVIAKSGATDRVPKDVARKLREKQERENALGILRNGISVPLKVHHLRVGELCFLPDNTGRTDYRFIFLITSTRAGKNGRKIFHLKSTNVRNETSGTIVECDAMHSLKVRLASTYLDADRAAHYGRVNELFDKIEERASSLGHSLSGRLHRRNPRGR